MFSFQYTSLTLRPLVAATGTTAVTSELCSLASLNLSDIALAATMIVALHP